MKFGVKLPQFLDHEQLPHGDEDIARVLSELDVECFALGPKGTNIHQACQRWLTRMGLTENSAVRLSTTPEEAVASAKRVDQGVVAIFWTCAVFVREYELFFGNPGTLPFFVQETMNLDVMQLATLADLAGEEPCDDWRIATHPSPEPLVSALPQTKLLANSNSHAAQMVVRGDAELCITTEEARQLHNLKAVHVFGSPPMVFFGGITAAGAATIAAKWEQLGREVA